MLCEKGFTAFAKRYRPKARATRLLPNIRNFSYQQRYDIDIVDKKKLFHIKESNTRGHRLKIFKAQRRTNIKKYSFSQRVVNVWNSLPPNVINAQNVNSFKHELDKFWYNKQAIFLPDF